MLTTSKWARDDSESDDKLKTNTMDLGLTYSLSGSANACEIPKCVEMDLATDASVPVHHDSRINEEQRQKLRNVNVALIEYRDSLEDRGVIDVGEIEKKVTFHRKHLESKLVVHFNKNTRFRRGRERDRERRRMN
ncbi:hypothetical protein POM88_028700 [Heracleum sosnowskyi]|uniref:CWF21 domain-containing protein n=1 Tax=Heracleum sosnowskyi TaxID=360622 RepID=A0AAD8HU40_9APIA|nr:hypothetical protein POM88_028700 [Heracleum sosnowskyi]